MACLRGLSPRASMPWRWRPLKLGKTEGREEDHLGGERSDGGREIKM